MTRSHYRARDKLVNREPGAGNGREFFPFPIPGSLLPAHQFSVRVIDDTRSKPTLHRAVAPTYMPVLETSNPQLEVVVPQAPTIGFRGPNHRFPGSGYQFPTRNQLVGGPDRSFRRRWARVSSAESAISRVGRRPAERGGAGSDRGNRCSDPGKWSGVFPGSGAGSANATLCPGRVAEVHPFEEGASQIQLHLRTQRPGTPDALSSVKGDEP